MACAHPFVCNLYTAFQVHGAVCRVYVQVRNCGFVFVSETRMAALPRATVH